MTNLAARSSLRRVLLLGAAAAAVSAPAAHAAPGDVTPLHPSARPPRSRPTASGPPTPPSAATASARSSSATIATGVVTPVTNGDLDSDTSSTRRPASRLDISVDGRYVVFDSAATNLVPGLVDANNIDDVFRWDRTTGAIVLVSAGPAGGTVHGRLAPAAMSRATEGTVVFQSTAKLSTVDPGAFAPQVYVRDMVAGLTTMASVTTAGAAANPFAERSDISADGRYVSFVSDAADIVAGDAERGAGRVPPRPPDRDDDRRHGGHPRRRLARHQRRRLEGRVRELREARSPPT